jgi:hypothetical protein
MQKRIRSITKLNKEHVPKISYLLNLQVDLRHHKSFAALASSAARISDLALVVTNLLRPAPYLLGSVGKKKNKSVLTLLVGFFWKEEQFASVTILLVGLCWKEEQRYNCNDIICCSLMERTTK